jgi:hypothetical protein
MHFPRLPVGKKQPNFQGSFFVKKLEKKFVEKSRLQSMPNYKLSNTSINKIYQSIKYINQ